MARTPRTRVKCSAAGPGGPGETAGMAARQIEDSDGILIVPQGARRLPAPAAAPAPDKSHCCLVRDNTGAGSSRYLMAEATNDKHPADWRVK